VADEQENRTRINDWGRRVGDSKRPAAFLGLIVMTEPIGTMKQATKQFESTYSTAVDGMREYSLKVLEIARINADTAFDYAQQIMSVKSPSEVMELSTAHTRKQIETLTAQSKELAALGQKVAAASGEPLASGIAKTFSKVA
jgi:phasin